MGLVGAGVGALLGARGGIWSSLAGSLIGSYAEDKIREKVSGGKSAGRIGGPGDAGTSAGSDDPYSVLGCGASDPDEKVRSAYLDKVRRLHPDALESKDIPEELRALANAEMARVNAAWESVKAERKNLG